jgi:hypothetical protein
MVINADILRRDTVQLIQQIDAQIAVIKLEARELKIKPEQMQDGRGNWVMSPLLLAKAQAYNSLILLQTKK